VLTLEIELLTGVYRAALPDGSAPEWPPHPERVFSALVQAWGDGGERADERLALEWLEAIEAAPLIEASAEWYARDQADVYVPPNDARSGELALLPDHRSRQARSFTACIPADPIVRLQWPVTPPDEHLEALRRLAHRVSSLGHSASFVRVLLQPDGALDPNRTWRPHERGSHSLRGLYRGRLADLVAWYREGRRPLTRSTIRYAAPEERPDRPTPSSVFGGVQDWFVFEDVDRTAPDLLGFAHVARRLRHALMSLGPQPPPEVISGHSADGSPSQRPHAAIVPLLDVGWPHSSGRLLGLAVVLPRTLGWDDRAPALTALARFARVDRGPDALAELRFARFTWSLRRLALPDRASLDPARWCGTATTWASATPVVLDRFPDRNDPVQEAAFIAESCRSIGLPEPISIEIHKHSALRGAPSAYPARGAAHVPDWSFPAGSKLVQRPRRHVWIEFAEPVTGPMILGAGRYQGFGLCLPVDRRSQR
jgi:CRISPR-associated protein Csb2